MLKWSLLVYRRQFLLSQVAQENWVDATKSQGDVGECQKFWFSLESYRPAVL